ncbi:MAG: ankyrin repeat domain-containing protein [Nitrosomonadales bacterium]|nr:ankyrin repeat domain-containing protein [Nitrosomonadales bacterium]
MNEKLLFLLDGYEECYPLNMEEKFPRIMNKIVELWDSREIDDYFTELMIDNRGGTRQGFPPNVASEIFALSNAHASIRDGKKKRGAANTPWDQVEESKKASVEQEGYKFSPQGFLQSVEKGDEKVVSLFVDSGVNVDARDERGWTPLMMSSFNGKEEIALLLIRSGASVHSKDKQGYGPLHWAAYNGYSNVVKLLIEKKAAVDARSNHGWTPLLQAATRGHLLAAGQLIAGGADVNLPSNDGWTPLHKAAASGHAEIVKLLLIKGAYRSVEYQDGTTPLTLATKNKHEAIVTLLTASS